MFISVLCKKLKLNMNTKELINCMNVIMWNRRFLQTIGIWPLKVFDPIFVFSFIYLFLHCISAFMDIANYSMDIDMIIANITENLLILTALIKITLCRLHKDSLSKFLIDIEEDFRLQNYRSRNEILSFVRYNRLSSLFIAIAIPCIAIATLAYYFRALTANINLAITNTSFGYQLPYKTQPMIPIDDVFTYTFYCLYQMLVIPYITFGYVGYDSFFVTLSLHVSGQLSVLNHRVKETLSEPHCHKHGMKSLIIFHKRLIRCFTSAPFYLIFLRLAGILEDDFNIAILQHLLITMWNICTSGYHTLKDMNSGQCVHLVIFIVFLVPVMSTLFTYCYVGECLIQESMKFGEAFYDTEWYNIPPTDLKLVFICMLRSSKPLQLTSGKFFVLSLCTFTDIIKTSVGYLSMIRKLSI